MHSTIPLMFNKALSRVSEQFFTIQNKSYCGVNLLSATCGRSLWALAFSECLRALSGPHFLTLQPVKRSKAQWVVTPLRDALSGTEASTHQLPDGHIQQKLYTSHHHTWTAAQGSPHQSVTFDPSGLPPPLLTLTPEQHLELIFMSRSVCVALFYLEKPDMWKCTLTSTTWCIGNKTHLPLYRVYTAT